MNWQQPSNGSTPKTFDNLQSGRPIVFARGNQNRKATREEMARVRRVIKQAFPDLVPIFGSHGDHGGHPRSNDYNDVSLQT